MVAPCTVRGLAPVAEKAALSHGPIPASLFQLGVALVPGRSGHRAAIRSPLGRALLPAGGPTTDRDRYVPWRTCPLRAWSPSSTLTEAPVPSSRPPTIGTSRASRIYGVAGRLDTPLPELSLRVGVYGHFAPVDWSQVFSGPDPGLRLMGGEPTPNTNPTTRR